MATIVANMETERRWLDNILIVVTDAEQVEWLLPKKYNLTKSA
jgi:hypothetical protein